MRRAVAVTGIGSVTPLGVGVNQLIERWSRSEDGFAADGLGRCAAFEPTEFLSKREVRRADRFVQFAIVAAEEAMRQAGWEDTVPYDPFRVATIVGSGIGGVATMETQLGIFRERGPTACSPLSIPLSIANAGAAAVAMRWGLRGHSSATVTACAAGADAITSGVRVIRAGEADAALVGGSESAISDFCRTAFDHMHATSPSGVCRPFDARRDGFVMGEGSGMLVLEDEAAALSRGAKILARLEGIGSTSDAFHLAAPDPSGTGAAQAIKFALADAKLTPDDVVYVNAHGTGTLLNDASETQALKTALGGRAHEIPISSTKSAIGHLLGGAGAVDAVATIAALRARVAPPTLNYEVPDEALDLDYVVNGAVPLPLQGEATPAALSNAFGFGGHNIVLAFTAVGERGENRQ